MGVTAIFSGIFFIFIQFNLKIIDPSSLYYVFNTIGYILLFLGLKQIKPRFRHTVKIQPYIIFMIVHSLLFTILNATDNSIENNPIAFIGLVLFVRYHASTPI